MKRPGDRKRRATWRLLFGLLLGVPLCALAPVLPGMAVLVLGLLATGSGREVELQ